MFCHEREAWLEMSKSTEHWILNICLANLNNWGWCQTELMSSRRFSQVDDKPENWTLLLSRFAGAPAKYVWWTMRSINHHPQWDNFRRLWIRSKYVRTYAIKHLEVIMCAIANKYLARMKLSSTINVKIQHFDSCYSLFSRQGHWYQSVSIKELA